MEITRMVSYEIPGVVQHLVTDFEIHVIERDFQWSCIVQGILKKDLIPAFKKKIVHLYAVKLKIKK